MDKPRYADKNEGMMPRKHAFAYTAATAFIFIAFSSTGQGESANTASGGDWRVECTNSAKALDCRAFVEVMERDSRRMIASLAIRYPIETKKPVIMVQVPLGVLVSEPVTITVDGVHTERFSIQTCTQAGCFAGSRVPDSLIAAMRTGKELRILFDNINKQPVTVTLPLTGFARAYDKIKS